MIPPPSDLFPDLPRRMIDDVKTYREKVAEELAEVRENFNVTTREIAEKCCVPVRTVESWMNGRTLPPEWSARLFLLELRRFYLR
jgi:DNA-binding transcriptional regulator YiaG